MPNQITRRTLISWLLTNGFQEVQVKGSGHRKFRKDNPSVTITVPGHGAPDLTKKHIGMIIRSLADAGFDKTKVRSELENVR